MRITVAVDILGPSLEPSVLTSSRYVSLPSTEVPDDSSESLSAVATSALANVDRAQATYREWWVALVDDTDSGSTRILPLVPTRFYGVRTDGRVILGQSEGDIRVHEFLRALDEGYYASSRHDIVLV